MCVDYTGLNKACPKDSYPLPTIDQLVDSTVYHGMYNFMDAAQGYHQIPMKEEDQEKTSFITYQGLYYYNVLPFGLKNARAIYRRLMKVIFKENIGNTIEVYIDDLIVKSRTDQDHSIDL